MALSGAGSANMRRGGARRYGNNGGGTQIFSSVAAHLRVYFAYDFSMSVVQAMYPARPQSRAHAGVASLRGNEPAAAGLRRRPR
ncbi:hypothetical protein ACU4GI_09160 [Cupriavidus basilensis]|uniref:hypothetical protein n=1 Tax=Cupriavidus sp. TaxID=1873897 RepID=UPI0004517A42|nr:hypothetical protein CF70_016930 [Cupriavidus sp. SK-3]